jgi:nitrous oxide reductase accessory protein NosL
MQGKSNKSITYSSGLKRRITVMTMVTCWLLLAGICSGASTPVEGPQACLVCGMDRAVHAHSRVLHTYADGSSAGFCSINCAAAQLKKHAGRRIESILVADYQNRQLTDARKAFWVMGGQKAGVMTSRPKWAFAREEDAREFMIENGGELYSFAQVLQAVRTEAGGSGHAGHAHGPGDRLIFNPAFGDDIYHAHPSGMWMLSYKFMRMAMDGLRDGTTDVATGNVGNNRGLPYDNYMMIPTGMTMDMHMMMIMYGINSRVTVMGMVNYLEMKMKMLMDMSPFTMLGMPRIDDKGAQPDDPMATRGLGDTELRGIYQVTELLNVSLGLSMPTGDTEQKFLTMGSTWRAPYDMQLGSGTFDLKPAVTLNHLLDNGSWNWGGQVAGTIRLGRNDNGYSLGDDLKATTWMQRVLGPAVTWIRLGYSYTGKIDGQDPEISKSLDGDFMSPSMPSADPDNYGGRRVDGFVGASLFLGGVSFGFESGLPLYQNLNGLQLKNDWYLNVGVQAMF